MPPLDDLTDVARQLYPAMKTRDATALAAILAPDLRARITAGLPHAWGGVYDSAQELIQQCWRPMLELVDVRPVTREFLVVGGTTVVVLGEYRIEARGSGRRSEAAFVHILHIADGRICELEQVTDSARWWYALRLQA